MSTAYQLPSGTIFDKDSTDSFGDQCILSTALPSSRPACRNHYARTTVNTVPEPLWTDSVDQTFCCSRTSRYSCTIAQMDLEKNFFEKKSFVGFFFLEKTTSVTIVTWNAVFPSSFISHKVVNLFWFWSNEGLGRCWLLVMFHLFSIYSNLSLFSSLC